MGTKYSVNRGETCVAPPERKTIPRYLGQYLGHRRVDGLLVATAFEARFVATGPGRWFVGEIGVASSRLRSLTHTATQPTVMLAHPSQDLHVPAVYLQVPMTLFPLHLFTLMLRVAMAPRLGQGIRGLAGALVAQRLLRFHG